MRLFGNKLEIVDILNEIEEEEIKYLEWELEGGEFSIFSAEFNTFNEKQNGQNDLGFNY